jgi:hypothetical protein
LVHIVEFTAPSILQRQGKRQSVEPTNKEPKKFKRKQNVIDSDDYNDDGRRKDDGDNDFDEESFEGRLLLS